MMSRNPQLEPYAKKPLPNYETVPLRKDAIMVAALQVKLTTVDVKNPKPDIRRKIDHVLGLIDLVQMRNQVDLFSVPEFALSGSSINKWSRDEFLKVAIDFPGEETELICRKAKEQDCYIQMAAYTKEADWPGHFFNCSFLVSPAGKIIHRHWKAHWDP